MRTFQEEFLCHFGVKGMRWGHRKSIVSDQPRRIPRGSKVDGYQERKRNLPIGTKVDGPQSKRSQRKSDYKFIKNRLKETGVSQHKLHNYETGYLSRRKVKKYLGKDIKVSQVSNYLKEQEKRVNLGTAGFAAGTTAAIIAYSMLKNRKR